VVEDELRTTPSSSRAEEEPNASGEAGGYDDDSFEDYEDDFEPAPQRLDKKPSLDDLVRTKPRALAKSPPMIATPLSPSQTDAGIAQALQHRPSRSRIVLDDDEGDNHSTSVAISLGSENPRLVRSRQLRETVRLSQEASTVLSLAPQSLDDVYTKRLLNGSIVQTAQDTHSDAMERAVETDPVGSKDQHSQFPEDLAFAAECRPTASAPTASTSAVASFLKRVAGVFASLLQEEDLHTLPKAADGDARVLVQSSRTIALCPIDGRDVAPVLRGRAVTAVASSASAVVVAFGAGSATSLAPAAGESVDPSRPGLGETLDRAAMRYVAQASTAILAVYPPSSFESPTALLVAPEPVASLALSAPHSTIIVGGTATGSLLVWDLRMSEAQHSPRDVPMKVLGRVMGIERALRPPSVLSDVAVDAFRIPPSKWFDGASTASDLRARFPGHRSRVVSVDLSGSDGVSDSTSLQVTSVDASGVVIVWTIIDALSTPLELSEELRDELRDAVRPRSELRLSWQHAVDAASLTAVWNRSAADQHSWSMGDQGLVSHETPTFSESGGRVLAARADRPGSAGLALMDGPVMMVSTTPGDHHSVTLHADELTTPIPCLSVARSPSTGLVVASHLDGSVSLWGGAQREALHRVSHAAPPGHAVCDVCWSTSRRDAFFTVDSAGVVRGWQVEGGRECRSIAAVSAVREGGFRTKLLSDPSAVVASDDCALPRVAHSGPNALTVILPQGRGVVRLALSEHWTS
jgi:hypothetical protein